MPITPHLLLIDGDPEASDALASTLEANGLHVTKVPSTREARRLWMLGRLFHLVVLDMGLPGEPGIDFARWLRGKSCVPILMLGREMDETEVVVGLELGADDYVRKASNRREVLARIRAILRRAGPDRSVANAPDAAPIHFAGWTLDTVRRSLLSPAGQDVPLTGGEYELLQALVERPNRVLTRDMLMNQLYGRDAGPFDRVIDVAISRLRRKLSDDGHNPNIIKTVRSGGYVLATAVEKAA